MTVVVVVVDLYSASRRASNADCVCPRWMVTYLDWQGHCSMHFHRSPIPTVHYWAVFTNWRYRSVQGGYAAVPLAEKQRWFGLCFVEWSRWTTNDHCGACIASETLLQNSRQLAVTIRNIRLQPQQHETSSTNLYTTDWTMKYRLGFTLLVYTQLLVLSVYILFYSVWLTNNVSIQ